MRKSKTKEIPLQERVRTIINKYDPIHLLEMGCPKDEYDPEIKRILPALQKAASADELHSIVYKIFVDMFDEDMAGPREAYRKLSKELCTLR